MDNVSTPTPPTADSADIATHGGAPQTTAAALRPEWKLALSLWLIYHVIGIALTPATLSPLVDAIYRRLYSPYLVPLNIIHRYRFFAPEPGPTSLIRWTITQADGNTINGEFPNRDIQPRQLYHRYFMLSERSLQKSDQEAWFGAYARHLLLKHGGEQITLEHVLHLLPTAEDIQNGKTLTAPEFYSIEEIGSWSRGEFETAAPSRGTTSSEVPQ